jgi:hypothetical protein
MLEARWNAARCKVLGGDAAGALADLEAVITADTRYEPKTKLDRDFAGIAGGDEFKATIDRLKAPHLSRLPLAIKVYRAFRAGLPLPVARITEAPLAPLDEKLQAYRNAAPSAEQLASLDLNELAAISSAVSECTALITRERERWEKEQQEEQIQRERERAAAEKKRQLDYLSRFEIKGTTVTGYKDRGGKVTIPDGITAIGEKAFYEKGLTSVVIPPSMTTIGKEAFRGNQLTSVEIPPGVTTIGVEAFNRNQLTSVVIPPGVTSIGVDAFHSNRLASVVIPPGVTSIGYGVFNSNKLTSVVIPPTVTSIGDCAFGFNQLTSVGLSPGVKTIGKGAFAENQLASVVIPPGVTTIGKGAFAENPLTSITIGANVKLSDVNVEYSEIEGPDFPNDFQKFYNRNGKRAGTYTWRKGLLGYGWTYSP